MDLWGEHQSVRYRDISCTKLHHKVTTLHYEDVMVASKHH